MNSITEWCQLSGVTLGIENISNDNTQGKQTNNGRADVWSFTKCSSQVKPRTINTIGQITEHAGSQLRKVCTTDSGVCTLSRLVEHCTQHDKIGSI